MVRKTRRPVDIPLFIRLFIFPAAIFVLSSCASVPPAHVQRACPELMPAAPLARADISHIVGPGETVYRIGRMYDVPVADILRANRISDPTKLKVGQKVTVPSAAPLSPFIPIFRSQKWKYIIVHHSATDSGDANFFDYIHRRRGFNRGLGYHFVIDNGSTAGRADGQIEASRRWVKQQDGAHCNSSGMNKKGIGICLVGDFTDTKPSQKQMDSLVLLINTLRKNYKIPLKNIMGHRDVPGAATECPGKKFPWKELMRRLRH